MTGIPPFDPQGVADHFRVIIAKPDADPDAAFAGLVEAISLRSPALSDEALAELKALVNVYKAYKEKRLEEVVRVCDYE